MKKNFAFLIIPTFLLISNILKDKISLPVIQISKEEFNANFDQDLINIFSIGQKRLLSNTLWIHTMLEGDIEKVQDGNSWMYHRFKLISTLEPLFYENYVYGGVYLSIIKDDVEGAADIYELGLKSYKNDFWLNYNSAFNDYFELQKKESALIKYKVALQSPLAKVYAKHLPSLVSRIQAETGGLEEAYMLLLSHYNNTPEGNLKSKLRENLYGLKAEIDLDCLNNKEGHCSTVDLNGNPYLLINEKYEAQKKWTKFRTRKRGGQKPSSKI